MSVALHEQVVDQARLLVRFLSILTHNGERTEQLTGPTADIAELLFQGFEHLHEALLEIEAGAPPRPAPTADPDAKRRSYREMVERVRARVGHEVPPGSTVAVVTRGDSALLQLPGLTGWHFPQNHLGVWAGYHPATGRDAVDHLESLRRNGARYFLVPGTCFWWLDFYDELREHLESSCRLILADNDFALYEIGQHDGPPVLSPAAAHYYRQAQHFADFADVLLPAGCAMFVVSGGDDALLSTRRVRALHFLSDAAANYMGSPASSAEAVNAVDDGVSGGVQYFGVPAPLCWWRDVYPEFFDYLDCAHRRIADQAEVGLIFELNPRKAHSING